MSFYKYCENCNCEMDFPNIVDSLIGKIKCEQCNKLTDLDYYDRLNEIESFVIMIVKLNKGEQND